METVKASITWDGAEADVLRLFVEPTPDLWEADPVDLEWPVFVFRVLDESEQETGEIAGVEIVGFLDFDRWSDLPDLPMLWDLDGRPRPLIPLLQDLQRGLREEASATARRSAGTA